MSHALAISTLLLLFSSISLAAEQKTATPPFSERERAAISSHYQTLQRDAEVYQQYHEPKKGERKNQSLPPGLQKKAAQGKLPPGWQKRLKVGAVLTPDVLAAADSLPPALVAQLPVGPAGTMTVHVDGQIIRVLEATRTIVDFFALPR